MIARYPHPHRPVNIYLKLTILFGMLIAFGFYCWKNSANFHGEKIGHEAWRAQPPITIKFFNFRVKFNILNKDTKCCWFLYKVQNLKHQIILKHCFQRLLTLGWHFCLQLGDHAAIERALKTEFKFNNRYLISRTQN